MVKLSTVISGNIWRIIPPPTPSPSLPKTQSLPFFFILFSYFFFHFFFFYTQNIPSTSADQTKQRLKTRPFFKTPSLLYFSTPLLSLKVIMNHLKSLHRMPPPLYPCPSLKNSPVSKRGHQSEGSCFDQMQYSFFSSELV